TGGTADWRNNTEGVFLGPTAEGSLQILIRAADVNSDGIPGEGNTTDQDFALVCYNCGSLMIFEDGFESGNFRAWSETVAE
ncbi:MAG: hypothetical protein K8R59_17780, partial [Thermoanaerobaculales bacterium]|nr:hypothetical protein [Thermoanaerobaculales bacterium]